MATGLPRDCAPPPMAAASAAIAAAAAAAAAGADLVPSGRRRASDEREASTWPGPAAAAAGTEAGTAVAGGVLSPWLIWITGGLAPAGSGLSQVTPHARFGAHLKPQRQNRYTSYDWQTHLLLTAPFATPRGSLPRPRRAHAGYSPRLQGVAGPGRRCVRPARAFFFAEVSFY